MIDHQPIQSGNFLKLVFSFFIIIGLLLATNPMQLVQAKFLDELDSPVNPLVKLQTSGDAWVTTGSMIDARHLHKATLLNNGYVLVSGGITDGTASASAELFDPSTSTWVSTASMNNSRHVHSSTLLPDGKVLVAGGVSEIAITSAELYDPSTGTWVATGALITARYDHTATLLPSGKVLVTGGNNGSTPIASAELYDPTTETWTSTGSMNAERWVHTATLLPNGKVLVAGGEGISGFLSSAELYDPDTGTWTLTPSMNTDHCYHSATLLQNGLVLVSGDASTGSVELYDPAADTWSVANSMSVARQNGIAVLLPDGKVLVAGGDVGGSSTNATETYDPETGLWSDSGSMNAARAQFTSALLPDGSVLVSGGYSGNTASNSAELYIPPSPTSASEDEITQDEPEEIVAETTVPESSDVKAYYLGPVVTVHLTMNYISSYAWPQNKPLTLTIDDPDNGIGIDYSKTIPVSGINSYSFDFYPTDFVIETGQLITLTDGTTTKTLTVAYLEIYSHVWDAFIVYGRAAPGAPVSAGICGETCYTMLGYFADENGYWQVLSYSHFDPADYNAGAYLTAATHDADWDTTKVIKNLPYPQFGAYVYSNTITGWDWPGGASLTITVDDPINGAGVDYTGSATVDGSNPEDPHFSLTLDGFDLKEGQLVSVTDGITTKSHTITSLTLTNVNFVTDHISGLAEPGSTVFVYASGSNGIIKQELTAASDGTWMADYSTGLDIVDLNFETVGYIEQLDEDYDITHLTFTGYLPFPTITKITPIITGIGSSAYTLVVTGTNFSDNAKVMWGSSALTTTFNSSTQLSAAVPAGFISDATEVNISVVTQLPGGGTSNTITHHAINISPAANEKLASNHVAFNWDDISGANLYTIQLSLSSTFSTTVLNTTTPTSNYSFTTALTNAKSYYWRIKARFGSEWSDWSSTWMFNSMNPPLAPVLASPAGSSLTNDNTPLLIWNAAANAHHYQVQVSKSTAFSPLEQDPVLDPGVLTYTAAALTDGMHFWRVRGIDSLGVNGAWSSYRSFTVDTTPQAVPAMVSPANGAAQLTTIPILTAGTVAGTKYYQFQVDNAEDFVSPVVDVLKTTPSCTLTSAQALPFGTAWWRVQSVDAAGNASGWSTPRSFVVTILKTPLNSSYTTDTTPAFVWVAASGALEYHIQVDDSDLFDSPLIDLNRPVSTSYTPLTALPFGPYYWRMQVRTISGWGNWTPVFTFTVTPALPLAPVLVSPASPSSVSITTPTFNWNPVLNAASYEIQVDNSSAFSSPEATGTRTTTWFTSGYLPNGTYYWRVRAKNINDEAGTWSAARSVIVNVPANSTTTVVSVSSAGVFGDFGGGLPQISENGRFVAYSSMSSNLVSGDTNETDDAFVYDQQTNVTSRVSISSSGIQGNYSSLPIDISADGRFVLFVSSSDNLVPGDTNSSPDAFVRDRLLNQTTRISLSSSGIEGNGYSSGSDISSDGRFVVFSSEANNLVSGDTNGVFDVFVHDRQTGQTTRISLSSSGTEGNNHSGGSSISGDGRFVTFTSEANNLVSGDTNGQNDVFVHDMLTGNTNLVSISSTGTQANGASYNSSISSDGRYIAFDSNATNLDDRDSTIADEYDVFLHDMVTGETRLVSVTSAGEKGNSVSSDSEISANGRFVVFISCATNLVSVDTNGLCDIFTHDLLTDENRMASINSLGGQGERDSYGPSISGDGHYVAFYSDSWAFVSGDYLGFNDVFVHEFR